MLDDSGQAPPGDKEWMAEPGSNGIAMDPRRPNTAYVCQHGKHAVRIIRRPSRHGEHEEI